jgi:SAM-dependent methyltransferase
VVGIDKKVEDLVKARDLLRLMEHEGEGGEGSWGVCVADLTKLPFADQAFDVVICSEVLEHIPEDTKAIREVMRILKPGELLVVSVPRFFPERICWMLSKKYRNEPGGHIRIYKKHQLVRQLERAGLTCVASAWAHALHSPYWWLKCLVGLDNKESWLVRLYHRFLVWDIVKRPWLTQTLDRLLNPLIAKSCVLYLTKEG